MAASASDVRSILALPTPQAGPSQKHIIFPGSQNVSKKPEGISRELYSLIGDSAPPLVPQYAKPKLKQRPNLGGVKTRWEMKEFTNSARNDNLKLSHWVKVGSEDAEAEYPFAGFNVTSQVQAFSLDEYTRLLEDPEWSKEETDYLFNVVDEYEMRWYVVHDRYEYPVGPPRGIDDLKSRYYGVCKKLIKSRPWGGDEASKNQLLNTYSFDKERELNRKNYVESLLSRTPEQLAEEESLFLEVKRLEQTERRFAKDRDHLLRTLLGIDCGLPLRLDDDGPIAAQIVTDKKKGKRKVDGIEIEPAFVNAGPSSSAPSLRKSTLIKSNAHDIQHCIQRFEVPANASTKSSSVPVYLRSSKTPTPKATLASKVHAILDEMGISYMRLVMPTQNNLAQLKGVFEAGEALVETKRAVDRVEQEIRVLKARLGKRRGTRSVSAGVEGEGSGLESGGRMEVDGEQRGAAGNGKSGNVKRRGEEGGEESRITEGEGEESQTGEGRGGNLEQRSFADVDGEGSEDGDMNGEGEAATPELQEGEEQDGDENEDDENEQDDDEVAAQEQEMEGEEGEDGDGDGDMGTRVHFGADDEEEVGEDGQDDGEADDLEDPEADGDGDGDGDAEWEEENISEGPSTSTRGARKRALSNSSMDTSGTTMTRRSSKRHRSRN